MARQKHDWTPDEIRTIAKLWETSSTQEIADQIGVDKKLITSVVKYMRKSGFNLPLKHQRGVLQAMLKDILNESH